jgi:hypothetical protein
VPAAGCQAAADLHTMLCMAEYYASAHRIARL